ncbi:MAG: D-2-hydroxyacid dehydrogenase [Clostridia bacterium]
MKILVTDGISGTAADQLKELGHEVVEKYMDVEELKEAVKEFDAIIIRSATKIRRETIDSAAITGKLRLAIRAGVGTDNIDADYAEENGIAVRNTPRASSDAVAELAIAHMLCAARFIGAANATMRAGKWNKNSYTGTELSGKRLGLIGFGRIARETARKARALGMKIYYTNRAGDKNYSDYKWLPMEELLRKVDFVSIHTPFDKDRGALIGEKEIAMMKDGVYIINTARGGVVNEKALLDALNSGKVAGAGIDVFEEEPTSNMELINHERVSATPHIGASTREAQSRIGIEIVNIINNWEGKDEQSL